MRDNRSAGTDSDIAPHPNGFEVGPSAARMMLGVRLRRLRARHNLSAQQVSAQINVSPSKLSRLESGRNSCHRDDLAALLRLYRVPAAEQGELHLLAERGRASSWWSNDSGLLPMDAGQLLDLEPVAERILCYETRFVPELLQTEDYARALLHQTRLPEPGAVDRHLAILRTRQHILDRPEPFRLWVLIEESALRQGFVPDTVHREQLDHLIDAADNRPRHLTLQVVPNRRCAAMTLPRPCSYFRFSSRDLPDLVGYQTLDRTVLLEERKHVNKYLQALHDIALWANPPDASLGRLRELRD